jgi:hypothetical protein
MATGEGVSDLTVAAGAGAFFAVALAEEDLLAGVGELVMDLDFLDVLMSLVMMWAWPRIQRFR